MNKPNKSKWILSAFIIAIMVISTFGFILNFSNQQQDYSYNGIEFKRIGERWKAEIKTPFGFKEYTFFYHPTEIYINISDGITELLKQSPMITIAFEPNISQIQYVDVARFELGQFLSDYGKIVKFAVAKNTTGYELPLMNLSEESIFIIFTETEESKAVMQDNVIIVGTSNPPEYLLYSELIKFKLLGII